MDFYQGVVMDYLRADKAIFVRPESCIQINEGPDPERGGTHWYCDIAAVDLRSKTVFLCEVTYAKGSGRLVKRLKEWAQHWPDVQKALARDCMIKENWPVRPWLFVPEREIESLVAKLELIKNADGLPIFQPRITPLECVQPWNYHSWDHQDKDSKKPNTIPASMRV